jgi:hypothetical protein
MAEQNPSLTLVKRLHQRTQEGRITWQESTSENTFLTAFPDHSIQISQQGPDYDLDYAVRIFDDEGHLVEEITLADLNVSSSNLSLKIMRDLFVAARRSAKGADRVVKSILDALGPDDDGDDDDIPF